MHFTPTEVEALVTAIRAEIEGMRC
jgi:hypothetical protein